MATINGIPYYEVFFNADGSLDTARGGDGGLPAAVAERGVRDLFVMSHGWNNGRDSARDLYQAMFSLLADQLGQHRSTSSAVGIFWPSLLFPDDDPAVPAPKAPPTGAEIAEALAPAFPDQLAQLTTMGQLLDSKPQNPDKLTEFHSLVSTLVTTDAQGVEDTGESAMLKASAGAALSAAETLAPPETGDAQGAGNPFSGLWSGARELLRTMSYYEMKNRAGVIGKDGLGPLLAALSGPPRIHLIGHSFGARLVAYTLAGLPRTSVGTASPVKSLTLIQGAFSHFAFATSLPFGASRSGALADYGNRVDGPLLATFSAADRAVGWWYPAASMLARQDSEAAVDLFFRWGAMGCDGYQQQPAAAVMPLSKPGVPYGFKAGKYYRLDSNAVVKTIQSRLSGAHSDIRHPQILWAIASAAGLPASPT